MIMALEAIIGLNSRTDCAGVSEGILGSGRQQRIFCV